MLAPQQSAQTQHQQRGNDSKVHMPLTIHTHTHTHTHARAHTTHTCTHTYTHTHTHTHTHTYTYKHTDRHTAHLFPQQFWQLPAMPCLRSQPLPLFPCHLLPHLNGLLPECSAHSRASEDEGSGPIQCHWTVHQGGGAGLPVEHTEHALKSTLGVHWVGGMGR